MKILMTILCFLISYQSYSQGWSETKKVTPSFRLGNDNFGNRVSISGDFAVVGSRYHDYDENNTNYIVNAGAAYIYKKVNGEWNIFQKIVPQVRNKSDYFGYEVELQGELLIVGAIGDSRDSSGQLDVDYAGAAYIYKFSKSLNKWVQEDKIYCSDENDRDFFGISAAIHGDYAIIGKYKDKKDAFGKNSLNNAGAVYVYQRDQLGNWNEVKKITPKGRDSLDFFGFDVDISKSSS